MWELFELCELEGNQRAGKDPAWAALLARVRVGKWTEDDIQVLESLVIPKYSGRSPAPGAVCLYATRAAVATRNRHYIQDHVEHTNGDLYECPAVDISVGSGAPLPPEKAWPLPEDTGGMESLLQLAVGAKVMLRKNLDVQDGLVNGACGSVEHVTTHSNREVEKVWVKFDKDAGSKWQAANETTSVAISRCSASFDDKDGSKAERRQFPLVLAKATTIHKSQAATYHAGVHARLDKHVKQEGQAYVALSRSPTQKLCTLECFDRSSLHFNANAQWALVTLKEKQSRSNGPRKAALRQLWEEVILPPEGHEHYKTLLHHLPPPDWKAYDEEQRAKSAPDSKDDSKGGGKLTCPQCGWTAEDAAQYKKHKRACPAKATAKAKTKAAAKAQQAAKAKVKSKAKAKAKSKSPERAASSTPPPAKANRRGYDPPAPDSPPPLPPPADPPPPDLEPPAPCFYFEKQQAGRCGMHALNHALGRAAFTPQDMRTAAASYLQEVQGIDDAAHEHIGPGGWYSVQILYTALFNRGYALDFHEPVQSLQEAHLAPALVQNWNSQHWVAYRWGHDGAIYLLDSMRDGPHRMLEEEFNATLAMHWTYVVEPTANP